MLLQVDLADELYIDPPVKWLTAVVVHQLVGDALRIRMATETQRYEYQYVCAVQHAARSKLLESMLALDREHAACSAEHAQ